MTKDGHRYCDRCGALLTKDNNKCGFEICDKCNNILEKSTKKRMTIEQHIENLEKLKSFHNGSYGASINAAINALEHEQALGEAFNIAILYGKEKGMEAIDKALYQIGMDGIKEQEIKSLEQELCEDAISREDAYKIVMMPNTPYGKHKGRLIRELPSVNPQPKIGYWKRISMDKYVQHAMAYYRCSECGKDIIGEHNYCPNCGARMVAPRKAALGTREEDKE